MRYFSPMHRGFVDMKTRSRMASALFPKEQEWARSKITILMHFFFFFFNYCKTKKIVKHEWAKTVKLKPDTALNFPILLLALFPLEHLARWSYCTNAAVNRIDNSPTPIHACTVFTGKRQVIKTPIMIFQSRLIRPCSSWKVSWLITVILIWAAGGKCCRGEGPFILQEDITVSGSQFSPFGKAFTTSSNKQIFLHVEKSVS